MHQVANYLYYCAATWIVLISRLAKTEDSFAVCEPRGQSHPDYSKCPAKSCKKHIDCWVGYGTPQSCVCDPHLCGRVCLPENAKCPKPKPPAHGTVNFTETNVADAAEYRCDVGLVVRGPRIRYCLATLKWSGEEPLCSNQTDTCFSPPDIPNSYLSAHRNSGQTYGPEGQSSLTSAPRRADYRSGEVIELRCLPGYRDMKRDYVEASCIGSEWHFAHLQCERIYCDPLKEPQHGSILYGSDKRFQSEARTVCAEGYTADCKIHMDGPKRDKAVTCPRLDAPTNGGLSTYTVSVHSVVNFHCNEGFEMHGPVARRCLPSGKWDGTSVVCKERNCGLPPNITQAKLVYNKTTYGSRAEFHCAPDTTPSVTEPTLICGTVNNQTLWLPQKTPRCNRHCYLFTVDQGEVVLMHKPNTSQQLLIPITADSYETFAKLGSHGNSLAKNGIILPGGRVRHNYQLNITCRPGYQLAHLKMSVTTCKDGVWSVRSKCVPASCANSPPTRRGARVRFYSRLHNAKARYECFPGYKLQVDMQSRNHSGASLMNDPIGTIRCLHGQWTGIPVYCEPTRCPRLVVDKMLSIEMKLPTQNTGEQQFPNEAIQGTLAFLHCPKGYHIQGQSVVVCHESQWLPSTDARCEKSIYPILPTEWLYRLP
ncbi:Sushi von Willebrand factor type A EGF and pentraxin domain-containing protein 1 [Fasciolopsis buskii]|uniref:Sushi von Willebrand factor type A EGF and pentraxin domain-containing protein 1 n=1 Tax=Fasciolopsis buskii TaxID=27845 RepID=A0A8E0RVW9_9TREM|nr:Sushi von Willebrand factor type A EGF and pentraxin domain-containing protein 1 [Fasciolopsis buski]